MSSPIASSKKSFIDIILIKLHQFFSHRHRISILANQIAEIALSRFPDAKHIFCLDVGCGDMQIVEQIAKLSSATSWSCIDIHELPNNLKTSERWKKYRQFNGANIPFPDMSFDVVLLCDVLHHIEGDITSLLIEAARVGKIIIIKDHIEYSQYSRLMLKILDFIGNWGYGVKIPNRYFTLPSFNELCSSAGLIMDKIIVGLDLYDHIFLLRHLLNPKWHFIAILKSRT